MLNLLKNTFFLAGCIATNFAFATEYRAVPGSQIIIRSVNQKFAGIDRDSANGITRGPYQAAFLGGFTQNYKSGLCELNTTQLDGWNGISVTDQHAVIGGFTGSISGGKITVYEFTNRDNYQIFTGGMIMDNKGNVQATGDVLQSSASQYFCGNITQPYDYMAFYPPATTSRGNELATIAGDLWIYVSKDLSPGTRLTLKPLYITQGMDDTVPIALIEPGDSLLIIEPPCTINTESHITFDLSSAEGRKRITPINLQCGDMDGDASLKAYLNVAAISPIISPTELALTLADGNPGGIVRGYAGTGAEAGSQDCLDTGQSLRFNDYFTTELGAIASGSRDIPLVWQLCTLGNEGVGVATGSAVLELAYK